MLAKVILGLSCMVYHNLKIKLLGERYNYFLIFIIKQEQELCTIDVRAI